MSAKPLSFGQWTKFSRAKSDLKLLDIDEQQILGWRDFESRINPGSRLKESADLPNRMIDLNWGRQYDIEQKRQHPPLSASVLSIAAYFRFREAIGQRGQALGGRREL